MEMRSVSPLTPTPDYLDFQQQPRQLPAHPRKELVVCIINPTQSVDSLQVWKSAAQVVPFKSHFDEQTIWVYPNEDQSLLPIPFFRSAWR